MSPRILPCLTCCISPAAQNVLRSSAGENMLRQIVQNLTPNKANLTQVACKSQKNVPLNLFKLGQVPRSSFYTHEYNLTSQQVFSLFSLEYWAGFKGDSIGDDPGGDDDNDPSVEDDDLSVEYLWWQRANTCNAPRFPPGRIWLGSARQIGINRRDLSSGAAPHCPLHIFPPLHITFWAVQLIS